jgi:hypothetical protein
MDQDGFQNSLNVDPKVSPLGVGHPAIGDVARHRLHAKLLVLSFAAAT